jgi:MoaD family protein
MGMGDVLVGHPWPLAGHVPHEIPGTLMVLYGGVPQMSGAMSRITVRMFATVREAAGRSEHVLDADDLQDLFSKLQRDLGPTLSETLSRLESYPEGLVILVNGLNVDRRKWRTTSLHEGDEVAVFPPVSGG